MLSKTNQAGFWQWLMRGTAVGGEGGEGKLHSAMPSNALWCSLSSVSWWLKPPVDWKLITCWGAEVVRTCNHCIRRGPLLNDAYPSLLIVAWARPNPLAELNHFSRKCRVLRRPAMRPDLNPIERLRNAVGRRHSSNLRGNEQFAKRCATKYLFASNFDWPISGVL